MDGENNTKILDLSVASLAACQTQTQTRTGREEKEEEKKRKVKPIVYSSPFSARTMTNKTGLTRNEGRCNDETMEGGGEDGIGLRTACRR